MRHPLLCLYLELGPKIDAAFDKNGGSFLWVSLSIMGTVLWPLLFGSVFGPLSLGNSHMVVIKALAYHGT